MVNDLKFFQQNIFHKNFIKKKKTFAIVQIHSGLWYDLNVEFWYQYVTLLRYNKTREVNST